MSVNPLGAGEPLLSSAYVRRRCYELSGYKPSPSTLWRWHLSGRLETTRIGGRLYATESAIRRMLERDAMRNRGTAGARGLAAAERLKRLVDGGTGAS
jgi:hypothetical protein